MINLKFEKKNLQYLSIFLATFLVGVAHAQTLNEYSIKYKITDGKVFAYQKSDPSNVYYIPNMTPEEVRMMEKTQDTSNTKPDSVVDMGSARMSPRQNDLLTNGSLFSGQTIPKTGAASNDALPALTFRDPLYSSKRSFNRSGNPVGGLPKYPGKNY